MIATVRLGEINFPLFLHVLGAMLLVGALFTVALTAVLSWRPSAADPIALRRLSFRTVLLGVFPAYLLMRVGAQWVEVKEGLDEIDDDLIWIGVGYITADLGALLIIVSMILAGLGLRKIRNGESPSGKAVAIISMLLIVADLIAVWAMTAKPV